MGIAKRKIELAGTPVSLNLNAPKFTIRGGDRINLLNDEHGKPDAKNVTARAVRLAILELVGRAFPQGMDRRDGKQWAAWQEILDEIDAKPSVSVPKSLVDWLRKHLDDDDLKVQPGLAQWREALSDYLSAVIAKVTEKEA